ncbi:MAG: hypothetical protein PHZ03_01460 [Syntrophomonas sp.]|nr:hypothetical protein [Syntrophomonas sp.]
MMNVARNIRSRDNSYEYKGSKITIKTNGADIISLESKKNMDKKEAERMTVEYLNEKLTYFYNNGGPIMEL